MYIYIYKYWFTNIYIWYDHHPELSWTMRNDHPSILTFKEINKRQKGLGSLAQEQRSVVLTLAKQKHEPSSAMFCCWTGRGTHGYFLSGCHTGKMSNTGVQSKFMLYNIGSLNFQMQMHASPFPCCNYQLPAHLACTLRRCGLLD